MALPSLLLSRSLPGGRILPNVELLGAYQVWKRIKSTCSPLRREHAQKQRALAASHMVHPTTFNRLDIRPP